VRSLISRVWEEVKLIEKLIKNGFLDEIREAALRWYLYSIHQNVLDSLAIIIAELNIRKPPSYASLADPLVKLKIVDRNFSLNIKLIARNRNRLAHAYRQFTGDELIQLAKESLNLFPKILDKLIEIAESKGVDPNYDDKLAQVLRDIFHGDGRVIAVVMFGSRARGLFREDSDYDLAILAKEPLGMEELNKLIEKISNETGIPVDKIDLIDLSGASNELIYEVIRSSIPLYVSNRDEYRRWIADNYLRILDEEDLMDIYFKRLMRKIRENTSPSKST